MKRMNKKRASQSARIQELEQHIEKLYRFLYLKCDIRTSSRENKDANTDTKEEREKE